MPELAENVAYLSQEIGPRPAGTEEEQQAALYITEQLQKDAGLSAVIEDFSNASGTDTPQVLCCGVTLVVVVLSLFVPALAIPAIILSLLSAVLFAAEAFGRPVLSRLLARGVSQNVVAKYEPGYAAGAGGSRRRKVILVARYDSGKVRPELNGRLLSVMPAILWANLAAMVVVPFLVLIRSTLFPHAVDSVAIVFNVLTIILLVLVALPIVGVAMRRFSSYNEGANCNASGVAVLLEAARRVGRGRVSEADLTAQDEVSLHGEQAARAAGLVPDGAQLVYEAGQVAGPEFAPQSPEARLASAKAAVAALSGKPVSGASSADIAQHLVQIKEPPLPAPTDEAYREQRNEMREAFTTISPEDVQAARSAAEASGFAGIDDQGASTPSPSIAEPPAPGGAAPAAGYPFTGFAPSPSGGAVDSPSEEEVPDWFKKAQEKAKKPAKTNKPVQRSRYASALDAAVSESAARTADAGAPAADAGASAGRPVEPAADAGRPVEEPPAERRDDVHDAVVSPWSVQPQVGVRDESPARSSEAPASPAAPEEDSTDSENLPARDPAQEPSAAVPAERTPVDQYATIAMESIDVSDLRIDDVPPMEDIPMPSFLDPRNAQRAAQDALREEPARTRNRIDVTANGAGEEGRPALRPETGNAESADDAPATAPSAEAQRPIVLPDIGVASGTHAPLSELSKQRAPLADAEETGGKSAAKSLLNMLPEIDLSDPSSSDDGESATCAQTPDDAKASLRSTLPSLSGAVAGRQPAKEQGTGTGSTGSFTAAGATGAFAPVGSELMESADSEDIYVEDADDSAYESGFTETGAFAGPGYVEMPKSRVKRFFGRFRHKNKTEAATPQEWLDVDESFDAREVGAERGGWESFRQEDPESGVRGPGRRYAEDEIGDSYEEFEEDTFDGLADEREGDYSEGDYYGDDYDPEDDLDVDDEFPSNDRGRWQGGAFSRTRIGRVDTLSGPEEEDVKQMETPRPDEPETPSEIRQIYQFRNPDINTEVWFVALGSQLTNQAGIRSFIAEHQQDLHGSIFIDLDALGAGSLSMIESEGAYQKTKTSSRMRRYAKKASHASGVSVDSADIKWQESATSYAIRQGYQAMHLVGMDGMKPALFAQSDDLLENIDEDMLRDNTDFVMELLKNI